MKIIAIVCRTPKKAIRKASKKPDKLVPVMVQGRYLVVTKKTVLRIASKGLQIAFLSTDIEKARTIPLH